MKVVSYSETSIFIYQTTWSNIPEDNRLQDSSRENLISLSAYYRYLILGSFVMDIKA
jgi:hypothetical protein